MTVVRALRDDRLQARVLRRTPLLYASGADAELDRPAHVRAGSSLAWLDHRLVLVQDDANFLALVEPRSGHVDAVPLPTGKGGKRLFGDDRGTKKFKLDLEACCVIPGTSPVLLAFGSGSKKRRRNIAVVDHWHDAGPRVHLVDATPLYLALESLAGFSGNELNIEGALCVGDTLRLFNRGNGKVSEGAASMNATCDLSTAALLEWLDAVGAPLPRLDNAVRYDLGVLGDVRLSFTDATVHGPHVMFSAVAENTDDASEDGAVMGSAIGFIAEDGKARYAVLTDEAGGVVEEKVEGLVIDRDDPGFAWAIVDADDTAKPATLCRIALTGVPRDP